MDSRTKDDEYESIVKEVFSEKIPFKKILGLHVESIAPNCIKVFFKMRDDFMENYTRDIFHGGVISFVIDATGGLAAVICIQEKMRGKTLEAKLERSWRVSTIDLLVDFLRPGVG